MTEPVLQIEETNDAPAFARRNAQDERGRRYSDWIQDHRADLLLQA